MTETYVLAEIQEGIRRQIKEEQTAATFSSGDNSARQARKGKEAPRKSRCEASSLCA